MIREPVVSGKFYPSQKSLLEKELLSMIESTEPPAPALGVISPHAGYIYSGSVAGCTLRSVKPVSSYIIMGPNHTGMGAQFAVSGCEYWKTPLGNIKIDSDLRAAIIEHVSLVESDDVSNAAEHSVEVQLPFLQLINKDPFTFVPMVISQGSLDEYRNIGRGIARAVKDLKREGDVVIVASSDMTHYESRDAAKKKDFAAIEAILALDEERLFNTVMSLDISMCGYAPVIIMMAACKALGAKKARLIKYQTSGDVTGDYREVVGYAGMVIS